MEECGRERRVEGSTLMAGLRVFLKKLKDNKQCHPGKVEAGEVGQVSARDDRVQG